MLELVDVWATKENRSVVNAIMARASLRVSSAVGVLLQSPGDLLRVARSSRSYKDRSEVSEVSSRFSVPHSPGVTGEQRPHPSSEERRVMLKSFLPHRF